MPRTLGDWLQRIEGMHPAQIALGLDRVATVAGRMRLGDVAARVITVGGTNGKGSCIAAIERLLLAQGACVGAYTSPHLLRYNERVRVGGREAGDQELCEAFAVVEIAREDIPLTFFEFGTLAALEVFRRRDCHWQLLEVGLGGRLDAVNIIDADIAVITSIAIDHTDWLGADRNAIALEKAGIMRLGRPVVCGDREPPRSLRDSARVLEATWYGIGEEFDVRLQPDGWHWTGTLGDGTKVSRASSVPPALLGDNVACALQALALADALPDDALLRETLPGLGLAGRQQCRRFGTAQCVLDVAHNPAGIASLVRRLQAEPVAGRTYVLFAAMRDKDASAMLATLSPLVDDWTFAALSEARAATPAQLTAALAALGRDGPATAAASIAAALERLRGVLSPRDRLVVCGSFHLVGPALEWLDVHEDRREELQ